MTKQLAAQLHELRLVARNQLPDVAGVYYEATNIVHTSAYYETSVFRGDDPVGAAWRAIRDRLQRVLGDTSSNLYDVAIALDEVTTALGKTDRHGARRLLAAREATDPPPRDPRNPAHSPDPKRPGESVNTKTTVYKVGSFFEIERETPVP